MRLEKLKLMNLKIIVAIITRLVYNLPILNGGDMMDELNSIAARIRRRREELELSYQDLADLTGMSKSTLQRYETGEIRSLPISKVPIIAAALDMTPTELTGWLPPQFSADEQQLVYKYRALDERGRETVDAALEQQYQLMLRKKAEADPLPRQA